MPARTRHAAMADHKVLLRSWDEQHRLRLMTEKLLSATSAERDDERRLRLVAEEMLRATSAERDDERRLRLVAEEMLQALQAKLTALLADREIEVQALKDKLDALLAAGLDAGAAHSKALSDRDSEIASLRARVVEMDAYNNPQAGGPEASGDSDKSEINNDEEGGGSEKMEQEKLQKLARQEKAPYVAKAEKLKAEYTKKMDAYNNPQEALRRLAILTSPSPRSTMRRAAARTRSDASQQAAAAVSVHAGAA